MSATLTVAGLDVARGPRALVSGLDLTLAEGDVVALVGANGSGKSSVMLTLIGELPVESGSVRLAPPDATVGYLPQVPPGREQTLLGYTRRRTGVEAADRALESAADALAREEAGSAERYTVVLERWLALGAADLADRLPEVAARVGLSADPSRPLGTLSGGQAARASLVAVLLSRHAVLLLDEPTNDLDGRGLELMGDFVEAHPGPVLLASHHRTFLDRVATRVVELDLAQQRIGHYTGGWSDYVAARGLVRARAREAYQGYAEERDSLLARARQRQEWAAKGRRGLLAEPDKHLRERDRARADRQLGKAGRLVRAVDRLDAVPQPRKEWQLRYAITEGPSSAEVVATLAEAVVERGDFVLGPVSLTVGRGDRTAILGDNGSGKTTLLAALLGRLPLARGRQSLGSRVEIGLLDQQRRLLDTDDSVLEVVRAAIGLDEDGETRTLLAKFGLGAEHVHRPAGSLSLGERTRAVLAVFQGRAVNTLVLDEPTNHLDVEAVVQLEDALREYAGTLLVVSHDQALLDAIGVTHRWHVASGRLEVEAL